MTWRAQLCLSRVVSCPTFWRMLEQTVFRGSPSTLKKIRQGRDCLFSILKKKTKAIVTTSAKSNWSPIVRKHCLATAHRPWGIYEQLQAHLLTSVGDWATCLRTRIWLVMSCANEFRDFLSLYSYSTRGKYPPITPTWSWIIDFSFEVQMSWMKTDCNIGTIPTSWFTVH